MKILLIEDRVEKRQNPLCKKFGIDIKQFADILTNIANIEELKQQDLSKYNLIICHKTAFDGSYLNELKNHASNNKKPLVFFSGEIDSSSFQNVGYDFSQVNDEIFYKNLKLFLDDVRRGNLNILILNYGELWKLNIVCGVLENINILIEKNRDEDFIDYGDLSLAINFDSLSKVYSTYYQVKIVDDEITIEELIKLRDSIKNYISQLVNE